MDKGPAVVSLNLCASARHAICPCNLRQFLLRVCVCVAVDFVSNNACLCICICIYVYMYICVYINISASNLKHQPSITRNNNRTQSTIV